MIVVTSGETYTDIDGLACAVAYSELLNIAGKSSCVVLPGVLNHSVSSLVRAQDYTLYDSLPDQVDGYILVDISNENFSRFVEKERVLEVYDHHYGYDEFWKQYVPPEDIHIDMIGACATLIWEAYVVRGLQTRISVPAANLLTIAIISNTLNLQSPLTTARDKKALVALQPYTKLPLDWKEVYYSEQEKIVAEVPVATITNDAKVQRIPALADTLVIGQLELWDGADFFDTHLPHIKTALTAFGHQHWMMNVPSISEGKNYIYTESPEVQELLRQALGCEFVGNSSITSKLILRKEILKALYTLPSDQNTEDDFVVKLYTCPVPFPFTFAVHAYIVLEHGTDVIRYDVNPIPFSDIQSKPFGHIQKNILPPETGFRWLGKNPFNFGPRYIVSLVGKISGDAASDAGKLYRFMAMGGLESYPFTHTYRLIRGPNSNTFIQWVLDQVPDSGLRLPSNAWGKDFKY